MTCRLRRLATTVTIASSGSPCSRGLEQSTTVREDHSMRRQLLSFLVILCSIVPAFRLASGQQAPAPTSAPVSAVPRTQQDSDAFVDPFDDGDAGRKKFWAERTRGGPIPLNAYERAKRQQWDKLPKTGGTSKTKSALTPSPSSLNGVVWRALGPSSITGGQAGNSFWNGRTNGIAINPFN